MKMNRRVALILSLALLLAAAHALGEGTGGTRLLRLGTSPLTLRVDDSFTFGELTDEDRADDQVAYLYSDRTLLDFDVYQFGKADVPADLADYVNQEAAAYPAVTELVADADINGIPAAWYRTVEEYEEAEYETLTYVLDLTGEYVEVVFWLDGDGAEAHARAIMDTLSRAEMKAIRLGTSPYCVFSLAEYEPGGLTEEDIADDQVAYLYSDDTLLDFDVYQFGKDGLPEALADYAAQEAATYTNVSELVTEAAVNEIPVAWYRTVEEYEEAEYETLTYILDAGDGYVEVVFWLDDANDEAEAQALIQSLTAVDE